MQIVLYLQEIVSQLHSLGEIDQIYFKLVFINTLATASQLVQFEIVQLPHPVTQVDNQLHVHVYMLNSLCVSVASQLANYSAVCVSLCVKDINFIPPIVQLQIATNDEKLQHQLAICQLLCECLLYLGVTMTWLVYASIDSIVT